MRARFRTIRLIAAAALAATGATGATAAAGALSGAQPLTLAAAVALALAGNPALRAAAGREAAAQAAVERAASERWPQLRLDSRVGRVSEVPAIAVPGLPAMTLADKDSWVTTATLQQLLFAGGRVVALERQAGHGAAAARAAEQRTRQTVAFAAERAFRLLLAAQEETAAAEKNRAAAASHLEVARDRLAARAAARFDVLRAEVQLEEARQDVIRADGARVAAHALLLQALGLADGQFEAIAPARLEATSARAPEQTQLAEARRLRPDLAALRSQVAAAEEGVRAARAERLPTLAVSADYLYADPESRTLLSRWSVGAALSLPLLDGGRAGARRAEAEGALAQARAAHDAQLRAVEAEVRQALARAAAADALVAVAARRLEQAEELLRLAEVRFSGGVGTATEVADAQASLAGARYGLARAGAEQGIAGAELALAVGTTTAQPARPAALDGGGGR